MPVIVSFSFILSCNFLRHWPCLCQRIPMRSCNFVFLCDEIKSSAAKSFSAFLHKQSLIDNRNRINIIRITHLTFYDPKSTYNWFLKLYQDLRRTKIHKTTIEVFIDTYTYLNVNIPFNKKVIYHRTYKNNKLQIKYLAWWAIKGKFLHTACIPHAFMVLPMTIHRVAFTKINKIQVIIRTRTPVINVVITIYYA